MRMREVILRAVNKEITWIQAADILGVSARSMRRWKIKVERAGFEGLIDGRTRGHGWPRQRQRDELESLLQLVVAASDATTLPVDSPPRRRLPFER